MDNGSLVEAGIDLFQVFDGPLNLTEINENSFVVFPNPSNGEFQIQSFSSERLDFRIHDTSGRLIFTDQFANSIDIQLDLSPGLYHMTFETLGGDRVQKKMVIH